MSDFPKQLFGVGASAPKDTEILINVIKTAVKNGITAFDTAPSYGNEKVLSDAIKEVLNETNKSREDIFIQTKIDAWQMQKGANEVANSVEKVLVNMKLDYLDALLVHWPVPEYFNETWKVFCELQKSGIVKNIGVCNVRKRQINSMLELDCPPQIVQIERNPLMAFTDEVNICAEHGIFVQAYSPLCKMDSRISESEFLKELSDKYNKNIGQIVLRWHIDTGVAPIFTSTKDYRVKEYSEIFDFCLNAEEIKKINAMNINYKMYLEAWACPGF